MRSLSEVIESFETEQQAAKVRLESQREEAQEELREAQKNIIAGTETTGSTLHDGLLVVYGADLVLNSEIITNYERVTGELQGKVGEPILLAQSWTKIEGCTGFGSRGQRVTKTAITLGLLAGTEFVFDYGEGTSNLPTSTYARKESGLDLGLDIGSQSPDVHTGNLQVSHDVFAWPSAFDLGRDLDRGLDRDVTAGDLDDFTFGAHDAKTLTVHVGRTAIDEWITGGARSVGLHSIQSLCEAVAIEPLGPSLQP